VPYPTDNPAPPSTLPDPELNPLLNPLLAAHMGRWAEVYYTSTPEKRGEAVALLLRELENNAAEEQAPAQNPGDAGEERESRALWSPATSQPAGICGSCLHRNPAGQKFCGMCGAPLQKVSPETYAQTPAETAPTSPSAMESAAGPLSSSESPSAAARFDRLREEDLPSFAVESPSRPYRYRLYLGVALILLLPVLVYMAWRRTDALSGAAATHPALSRAVPAESPDPAVATNPPSATGSSAPTNPPAAPVQDQGRRAASSAHKPPRARSAAEIVRLAAGSTSVPAEQGGAEELAMAERYLNGSDGRARDPREAAQWLWKAVGKGNVAATMALSDLYLRGEGVPKSCDQGRLLLDAAARKGDTSAAERIRNWPAFGCQ
jgi:hypothetical protein